MAKSLAARAPRRRRKYARLPRIRDNGLPRYALPPALKSRPHKIHSGELPRHCPEAGPNRGCREHCKPGFVASGSTEPPPTGLTLDSELGDVNFGRGERLTVPGPLAINALETAQLADLAAFDVAVQAADVTVLLREPGVVELPSDENPPTTEDDGVDILGDTVTIEAGTFTLVGVGTVTFGVENQPVLTLPRIE